MGSSSTRVAAAAGLDYKFCLLALPAYACYRVVYYFTSWLLTLPALSYESGGATYKLVVWALKPDINGPAAEAPPRPGPASTGAASAHAAPLVLRQLISHLVAVVCPVAAAAAANGSWQAAFCGARAILCVQFCVPLHGAQVPVQLDCSTLVGLNGLQCSAQLSNKPLIRPCSLASLLISQPASRHCPAAPLSHAVVSCSGLYKCK